jgi:two-component system chemotaxis response regulator CheY
MPVDFSASVLVVDDVEMMSDLVIRLMQRLGFKDIDRAADGAAAWERLQGKCYGLVISDLEMENMDGVDLLERLREDERHTGTRFIMITGHHTTQHVAASRRAGADGILLKPFSAKKLKEKVEQVFAIQRRS